jgi:hypothetical protein
MSDAFISKSEAARLAGVHSRTIDRRLAAGVIHESQTRRNAAGHLEFSRAEILRVFPQARAPSAPVSQPVTVSDEHLRDLQKSLERERQRADTAEARAGEYEQRFHRVDEQLKGFLLPAGPAKKKWFGIF